MYYSVYFDFNNGKFLYVEMTAKDFNDLKNKMAFILDDGQGGTVEVFLPSNRIWIAERKDKQWIF